MRCLCKLAHFLFHFSGGDLTTVNPTLGGLVEMAGNLCAGVISVNSATILDTLSVGFDSITVDLTGVPSVFSTVVSDVTTQLSSAFNDELTSFVEPTIRPIIQSELNSATSRRAFSLKAILLQAQAITNNAQDTVEGWMVSARKWLGMGA